MAIGPYLRCLFLIWPPPRRSCPLILDPTPVPASPMNRMGKTNGDGGEVPGDGGGVAIRETRSVKADHFWCRLLVHVSFWTYPYPGVLGLAHIGAPRRLLCPRLYLYGAADGEGPFADYESVPVPSRPACVCVSCRAPGRPHERTTLAGSRSSFLTIRAGPPELPCSS